jgi:hypothetical protein
VRGPRSRPDGVRSGLNFFLLLKIDFWCRLGTVVIKNGLFFVSYIWYRLAYRHPKYVSSRSNKPFSADQWKVPASSSSWSRPRKHMKQGSVFSFPTKILPSVFYDISCMPVIHGLHDIHHTCLYFCKDNQHKAPSPTIFVWVLAARDATSTLPALEGYIVIFAECFVDDSAIWPPVRLGRDIVPRSTSTRWLIATQIGVTSRRGQVISAASPST